MEEKTYKERLLEIYKAKRRELETAEANDYNTGAYDMIDAAIRAAEKLRE